MSFFFSLFPRTTSKSSLVLFLVLVLKLHSLAGAFGISPTLLLPTTVSNPSFIQQNRAVTTSLLLSSSSSTSLSSSNDDSTNEMVTPPLRVGFIGCGTIAAAIANGLATQTSVPIQSISISRRSESKSKALNEQHPNLVTVYDDNQEILNNADMIFICVLPDQTSSVLRELQFEKERHTLVSLVSTSTLVGLKEDTSLPSDQIYKCICLPAVSRHEGVCLVTPKTPTDSILIPLFESLGGIAQAEDEEQMSAMMVPSALMGSMYGMLKQSRDWLVNNGNGISKKDASFLVGRFFWGMMQDAERKCNEENAYEDLIEEQTPGGLNEQALNNWRDLGALESLDKVQDALFDRIRGKSDGSLE